MEEETAKLIGRKGGKTTVTEQNWIEFWIPSITNMTLRHNYDPP